MKRRCRQGSKEEVGSCESFEAETKIKDAAKVLHDDRLLLEVGDIDFVAKEVKYHHTCRKAYLNEAKCHMYKPEPSSYQLLRDIHEKGFQTLCEHVTKSIIQKGCAEQLSSLLDKYIGILADNGEYDSPYASNKLCDSCYNILMDYYVHAVFLIVEQWRIQNTLM